MKKIALFIIVLLSTSSMLSAQKQEKPHKGQQKSTEERVNHEVKRVTEKLQLTPKQQALWAEAATQRIQNIEPLKPTKAPEQVQGQQKEMSRDQKKAKHEANKKEREQFDTQVRSFLTPEQTVKYESIKKERQEKRSAERKGQQKQ